MRVIFFFFFFFFFLFCSNIFANIFELAIRAMLTIGFFSIKAFHAGLLSHLVDRYFNLLMCSTFKDTILACKSRDECAYMAGITAKTQI